MTSNDLEKIITEIKSEINTFSFKPSNLNKFDTTKKSDTEYLAYVNGTGGSYVKFLALLTKKLQPKNIVELGNREGLSTMAFYDQLPSDAKFTTIDIIDDVRYCPTEMFSDPRVSFIKGDVGSLHVLEQVPDKIDILFTDTIHYYFQLKDEFEIYQHLLADTAIFAIDDIHLNDKGKFWEEVKFAKWDLTEVCHHSGWGLFLFKREKATTWEERWNEVLKTTSLIWERKYNKLQVKDQHTENKKLINRLKNTLKKYPVVHQALIKIYYRIKSW